MPSRESSTIFADGKNLGWLQSRKAMIVLGAMDLLIVVETLA